VESLTSDRSVRLKTIEKKILSFVIILLKICPGNLTNDHVLTFPKPCSFKFILNDES